jgi:hypothetical protein
MDAAEALWEPPLIFQGFEVAFRERVVIDTAAAMTQR